MRLISEKYELCLTLVLVGQFIIHILVYWFSFNINKDIEKRTNNFYVLITVDQFNVGQVTYYTVITTHEWKLRKVLSNILRQQTFKYWNMHYDYYAFNIFT